MIDNRVTSRQLTEGQGKGQGKGQGAAPGTAAAAVLAAAAAPVVWETGKGLRRCKGAADCPHAATGAVRDGGRVRWTCDPCGAEISRTRTCADCQTVVRFGPDETLSRTRKRFTCESCGYRGKGADPSALTDETLTTRQTAAVVADETEDAVRRVRLMAAAAVRSLYWRTLADVNLTTATADPDVWDRATDRTLTECQDRVSRSAVPAGILSAALTGEDETLSAAVNVWAETVLRSGIRYRDTTGTKKGPDGRHYSHRETGWLSMGEVLLRNLATARTELRRADRRSRTTVLPDGTDGSPVDVILTARQTRMWGGSVPGPDETVSAPVRVLPDDTTGDRWSVATDGLRRDAVLTLSADDRAALATAVLSGEDDSWTGRQLTENRRQGNGTVKAETVWRVGPVPARFRETDPRGAAVRRAVSAYRDAVLTLTAAETARTETETLSALTRPARDSRETARRLRTIRPVVFYRPVTDPDGNRLRPVVGRRAAGTAAGTAGHVNVLRTTGTPLTAARPAVPAAPVDRSPLTAAEISALSWRHFGPEDDRVCRNLIPHGPHNRPMGWAAPDDRAGRPDRRTVRRVFSGPVGPTGAPVR